jgi:hypothetical protein
MKNMAQPERKPAEQPFIVTVGVRTDTYVSDCAHVLRLIRKAGFEAAPTRHDTFELIHEDPESLPQLREAGVVEKRPPEDDPPPAAA